MSNLTDGKKALKAGKFDVAERKLVKALELKPDDSELWWCMMLCRGGYADDATMVAALKREFAAAADEKAAPPDTPFSSVYCQNALRYARDDKRFAFVQKTNAELAELWREKTGKSITLKVRKKTQVPEAVKTVFPAYISIVAAVAGGVLAALDIWKRKTLPGVIGLLMFAAGMIAAAVFTVRAKRAGRPMTLALVSAFTASMLTSVAVFVTGSVAGVTWAVRAGQALFVITVAVAGLTIMVSSFRRRGGKRTAGRSAYDRSNVAAKPKKFKVSKKSLTEGKKNDYQDAFD